MNSNVSPNEQKSEMEIDIVSIMKFLLSKFWIILIAAAVMATSALFYVKFAVTPMYSSTSKIFITSRSTAPTSSGETNWGVGKQLAITSPELITNNFCNSVADLLNSNGVDDDKYDFSATLGMSFPEYYNKLSGSPKISGATILSYIGVSSDSETCMVTFQARTPDKKLSAVIVNAVTLYFEAYINQFMRVSENIASTSLINTKIASSGTVSNFPYNVNYAKSAIIFGMLGAIAACVVLAIINIFSDKIKTPEDVERYLNLTTLGSIPKIEEPKLATIPATNEVTE